jgi:hypothetical protein
MKFKNNCLILLIIIVSLSSCITVERCRNRFPCPINTEIKTVIRDTTIVTNRTMFDTIVRWSSRDTIFVRDQKTNIETKIVWLPGDSIFVKTTCPPDTIRVEKIIQTTINTAEVEKSETMPWKWFIWAVLAIVGIIAVGYLIKSIKPTK